MAEAMAEAMVTAGKAAAGKVAELAAVQAAELAAVQAAV